MKQQSVPAPFSSHDGLVDCLRDSAIFAVAAIQPAVPRHRPHRRVLCRACNSMVAAAHSLHVFPSFYAMHSSFSSVCL